MVATGENRGLVFYGWGVCHTGSRRGNVIRVVGMYLFREMDVVPSTKQWLTYIFTYSTISDAHTLHLPQIEAPGECRHRFTFLFGGLVNMFFSRRKVWY